MEQQQNWPELLELLELLELPELLLLLLIFCLAENCWRSRSASRCAASMPARLLLLRALLYWAFSRCILL